jgi:hypothetical protein
MPSADELRTVGEKLASHNGHHLWRYVDRDGVASWRVTRTDETGMVVAVNHFLFAESAIACWAEWSAVRKDLLDAPR